MIRSQQEIAQTADQTSQHAVAAARVGRVDLAARRRHRDHEHHARLGDRADARDRHPHGDRREGPRHPHAVPDRGARRSRSRAARSGSRSGSAPRGSSRGRRSWPIVLVAGRRRCSRSASRRRSASSSASTRRARRRGSIRSRRCGTSSGARPGRYNPSVTPVPFERLWRRLDPRKSIAARLLFGFFLAFLLPGSVVRLSHAAAPDGAARRTRPSRSRRCASSEAEMRVAQDVAFPRGVDRAPRAGGRGGRLVARDRGARWRSRATSRRPAEPSRPDRGPARPLWTEIPEEESVALDLGPRGRRRGARGCRPRARARSRR